MAADKCCPHDDAGLRTRRLLLRRVGEADLPVFEAILADPLVMRYSMGPMSQADVAEWFEEQQGHYVRGMGLFAVVLAQQDAVIGYCGLTPVTLDDGQEVQAGCRLAAQYHGRGYATEAVRAVCGHGFADMGLRRVVALIDPQNGASIRVARRVGMRYWKDVMLPHYSYADHCYVLDRPVPDGGREDGG